jgi:hypothetical protein
MQAERWTIIGFFVASWLTPVFAVFWGITFQAHVWLDADFLGELVIPLMALTIWATYISVGILGISVLFGLSVHTLRTTILSVVGVWFLATIHKEGMPTFAEVDIQAILFISIISLSTVFGYQVSKRKG